MILDRDRRFIFVHVPKCAGTSITRAIEPFVERGHVSPSLPGKHPCKHWSIKKIANEFNLNLSTWTICAVARNPWDQVVSDWQFTLDNIAKMKHYPVVDGWYTKMARVSKYRGFREFVEKERLEEDVWAAHCCDESGVDRINTPIRYENLVEEYNQVIDAAGFPPHRLKTINKTEDRRPYREVWGECLDLVDVFADVAKDFTNRFGYAF